MGGAGLGRGSRDDFGRAGGNPMNKTETVRKGRARIGNSAWRNYFVKNYDLYLMVLPGLLYYLIFHYAPMVGVQIAFKNYIPSKGIWGSEWVGLKHFARFFKSFQCWSLIENTVWISVYTLLVSTPVAIVLALMLNEVRHSRYKKTVQMVTYAPHFISTIVLVALMQVFFGQSTGFVNNLREAMGFSRVSFLGEPQYFRHMFVWSDVWQNTGWNSIIYISALASISPELHEAANVEGASKLQRIIHIDLPHILPTMIILLILGVGRVLSVGFEKVFLMQNAQNLQVSQVISTYVYDIGLLSNQYSYSTAVGLFNSVVTLVILLAVNRLAKRFGDVSLW